MRSAGWRADGMRRDRVETWLSQAHLERRPHAFCHGFVADPSAASDRCDARVRECMQLAKTQDRKQVEDVKGKSAIQIAHVYGGSEGTSWGCVGDLACRFERLIEMSES